VKVVVSCDAVIDRDYYLEAVEAALDVISENCELYTLVHNHGGVVGPIEQRNIHSSFLTNNTKGWGKFFENSYLIPSAAKNLFIPCSVDLIINISRGFSQGMKKCDDTKQITILIEDINSKPRKKTFKEKIFSLLVSSYQKKSLNQAEELWVSREDLIPAGYKNKTKVVPPPIKLNDYKILPDAMFTRDYILVNVEPLDEQQAQTIINDLEQASIKFKFIGKDDHLAELKSKYEQHFFGNKCSGEMAPLLSGCIYLVDFDTTGIPIWSLRTMASGRPVFSPGNSFIKFGEGFYELKTFTLNKIFDLPEFDKDKVRGRSLWFQEIKFKHTLNNFLRKLMPTPANKQESQEKSEECCSH
jgi:hypothetical protein